MTANLDVAWAFLIGVAVITLLIASDMWANWLKHVERRDQQRRQEQVRKILAQLPARDTDEHDNGGWW